LGSPGRQVGNKRGREWDWQRLVGTEGAVWARPMCVMALVVWIDSERLRTLTIAPAAPLPVSGGVANSPEELGWK
jgi:hypothetical protein